MADRYRTPRLTAGQRSPLANLPNASNTPPQRRPVKHMKSSSPHALPHNESYEPDGTLDFHHREIPGSPSHKRASQITEEDVDSKRNSAISTASTVASGRKRKAYIGHWQLGKTIGKGGCSRVRVVRHRITREQGAVKIIARSTAESTRAQSLAHLVDNAKGVTVSASGYRPIPFGLEREIAIMKLLEHDNIVKLYDVWENKSELYLIMEYVEGGELFHYVEARRGLPEDETVYIFRQIISALLYCHRLNICHRDLKPENILLNPDTMSVKLIDFGMAALQPVGRLLSTPCGSPHYAAPEVVSGRAYDGQQSDVWSSGVILYVMLTGTTPFNYAQGADGDIKQLFDDIRRANYYMPRQISLEAKDLIKKIFIPDPRRRITMDRVWDHAMLHKYDHQFQWEGPEFSKEAAIGSVNKLDDWTVKQSQDVDCEILRNMRTLWHSVPEQTLVQKLLSKEINQEKLFYAALLKHQEEQAENYNGDAESMGYSASDFHHSKPANMSLAPPLPPRDVQKSQSAYSIMNDEHLKPSHSFVEPPPSVSSYDPYRASRDPIVSRRGEYVNVVVHRNGNGSAQTASVQRSLRHPNSLRIEMLKHGRQRSPSQSTSNMSLPRSTQSKSSMRRSSASKHSLSSSPWPSSPPIIATMRPSDVHKRHVSFNHLRKSSGGSVLTTQDWRTTASSTVASSSPRGQRHQKSVLSTTQIAVPSSEPAVAKVVVVSKKEKATAPSTPTAHMIKVRNPAKTPSQYMRSEIRKHSAELEKACEEAFFRTSVGSSTTIPTSFTDKPSPYETPPSSVSAFERSPDQATLSKESTPPKRPLPSLPDDTPNTYLTRTLEETREKLAAFQNSGDENSAKYEEVLRMLETIMPTSRGRISERRSVSAPEPRLKTPERLGGGHLPIIAEEGSDHRASKDPAGNWYRSVTSPGHSHDKMEVKGKDRTVRLVTPVSPGTPAPLKVRKRRSDSYESEQSQPSRPFKPRAQTAGERTPESTIEHVDEAGTAALRKKKSGWFGLKKQIEEKTPRPPTAAGVLEGPQEPQDEKNAVGTVQRRQISANEREQTAVTGGQFSTKTEDFHKPPSGKLGLAKWFHRLKGAKNGARGETNFKNVSSESFSSTNSPSPSSDYAQATSLASRSWFTRFLHIKPATRVLCFSVPRSRVRSELVLLFKEWQRHGIRDLQYSRETNTITARVDKKNSLDIKPVEFRVELFVVLEHGRRVGLSIGRFVQVKGAVSGFRKVLEVVDGVMRGRGWLVEDEEKWKALQEIVM